MWQAQATVFPVGLTECTACIPYKCSKKHGFGQLYTDGTLYADGAHFEQDNAMIAHIINLMQCGVEVGIVTAAGYPGEAHKVRTHSFEVAVPGLSHCVSFSALTFVDAATVLRCNPLHSHRSPALLLGLCHRHLHSARSQGATQLAYLAPSWG